MGVWVVSQVLENIWTHVEQGVIEADAKVCSQKYLKTCLAGLGGMRVLKNIQTYVEQAREWEYYSNGGLTVQY